jgi:hypothetical protein
MVGVMLLVMGRTQKSMGVGKTQWPVGRMLASLRCETPPITYIHTQALVHALIRRRLNIVPCCRPSAIALRRRHHV